MKTAQIYPELKKIENELKLIRNSIANKTQKKSLISLRGIGKLLVKDKELDLSLIKAKKSLIK
jgi:ABC-type Fe3+-citrate transport system substrate-binding protein